MNLKKEWPKSLFSKQWRVTFSYEAEEWTF